MKYSQFLEFEKWKNALQEADEYQPAEAEKKSEEKKDPDALDTKKGNIITKRGRMRSSLNKQAKKLQDGINQNVANKFLKPIKDIKIKVYQKMAEVGKGKQPKEIVGALKADLQNIQKIQQRQMAQIEKYAQNTIDTNTKKINGVIEKKGLKDTTVADLQSYWGLLTTQIMMNLLQKIAVQDDNVIAEVIKDQDILKAAKQINAALNKPQKQKEKELQGQIEKLKGEIKAKDEAIEKAEKEKKTGTETPAEPEKDKETK